MTGRGRQKGSGAEKRPTGRPSTYSEEIAIEICRLIGEEGKPLKEIARMEHMPCASTIFKWLAEKPAFSDLYARACLSRGTVLFEEAIEMADQCPLDRDAAAAFKLRVETRKWAAAKLDPRYSDRHVVDLNATVKTITDEQLEARIAQLLGKA